jgi:hypothetical protein
MELAVFRLYRLACACIPGTEDFTEPDQRDAAAAEHAQCPGHVGVWDECRLIWIW